MESKWFTIFTRPNCEISVSKALTHKKIVNYCPLKKVITYDKEIKHYKEVPLFKSYVFVKIPETRLNQVRLVNGVINFLYYIDKPVTIEESEISTIEQFIKNHCNVRIEKNRPGTQSPVSVNKDSLRNAAVKVALPSLCCSIIGEAAPEIVKSRRSYTIIRFLKMRPQYTVKTLLMICLKLLFE